MVRFCWWKSAPALVKAAMAPVATTQALALTHWNRAPLRNPRGRAEASPVTSPAERAISQAR
ncbi:hypothetical protein D3C71_813370 [compost metagenome]